MVGDGTEQAAGLWCRRCGDPVRLDGGADVPDEFRKAVHAATGQEACAGGEHLAAPAGAELARAS
jgi:hypothetical protein